MTGNEEWLIVSGSWLIATCCALGMWVMIATVMLSMVWATGKLLTYWWQEITVAADVIDYLRHRKQFKAWRRSQTNNTGDL